MVLQYRTSDGDTADLIAWKYYGTTERLVVEQLLSANKGMADMGPLLPAGFLVDLPDIDTTEKANGVRLWD